MTRREIVFGAIGASVLARAWGASALAGFQDVRAVLEAMGELLPPELRGLNESSWASWSAAEDARIRARLELG